MDMAKLTNRQQWISVTALPWMISGAHRCDVKRWHTMGSGGNVLKTIEGKYTTTEWVRDFLRASKINAVLGDRVTA